MKLTSTLAAVAMGAAMFLGTAALEPLGATSKGVLGCWRTKSDKDGKIKSKVCLWKSKKNGMMYGAIKKLYRPSSPNPKCTKCRGWAKNKPIQGLTIVFKMKDKGNAWEGGSILDPNNGKYYKCKMWREGGVLKVRGYIGFLYRTQTWYR